MNRILEIPYRLCRCTNAIYVALSAQLCGVIAAVEAACVVVARFWWGEDWNIESSIFSTGDREQLEKIMAL